MDLLTDLGPVSGHQWKWLRKLFSRVRMPWDPLETFWGEW